MRNLNFSYDLSAHRIIHDSEVRKRLPVIREAGVETIYVFGYFYGRYESSEEETAAAKTILESEGFNTGIIHVPLGHGGNALNPDDPEVDITIGEGWHMRKDSLGTYLPTTTCIDSKVISDFKKVNNAVYDMGYRSIIYDDDLRLASWGANLQGCFCDRCMEAFSHIIGRTVSRKEIAASSDPFIVSAWMDFQCGKITGFLRETLPSDITGGIMIMHNGDRRHGIDIPAIKKAMPENFMFRVGEGHFNDVSYEHPLAKDSICASVNTQMALIQNDDRCFSETTVFPPESLSPENWIDKMELEISLGLRNLYLMSGTWLLSDRYWTALKSALPRLRELAETDNTAPHRPADFIWQI